MVPPLTTDLSGPFLIAKADAGTYGMGIMTVKSVDDARNADDDILVDCLFAGSRRDSALPTQRSLRERC